MSGSTVGGNDFFSLKFIDKIDKIGSEERPPPMLSNFTLRQLAYFVAAAEAGSTSRAAENLHMSQSSMSSALSELDSALGVELFIRRRGKGLSLTPIGEELLPRARTVLKAAKEVEATTKAAQDEHTGLLRIGCFDVIVPAYLPQLFVAFRTAYPEVIIEVTEGSQELLTEAAAAHRIDVVLTYLRGLPTTLTTTLLARPTPHALLPADHPLAGAAQLSLQMLQEEDFVQIDASPGREIIMDLFADNGVVPNVIHSSPNFDHVRAIISQGLGYGVISQIPGSTPPHWGRSVVAVPLTDTDRYHDLVIAYPGDVPLSRRARNFIRIARQLSPQAL